MATDNIYLHDITQKHTSAGIHDTFRLGFMFLIQTHLDCQTDNNPTEDVYRVRQ